MLVNTSLLGADETPAAAAVDEKENFDRQFTQLSTAGRGDRN